jgi:hypothetical protein
MSEHDHQTAVIQWANIVSKSKYPELAFLFAIPNAGAGAQSGQAGKMKAEGVKKGVPDLCLPVPKANYHGLFIEMKFGKNVASKEQLEWMTALVDLSYCVALCRSVDEAMQVLKWYCEGAVGAPPSTVRGSRVDQNGTGQNAPLGARSGGRGCDQAESNRL